MKTLKIIKVIPLTIMIIMIIAVTGYGKTCKERSMISQAKAVHKVINKSLLYPLQGKDKNLDGELELTFNLNRDGKISIVKLSSENDELTSFIENQLSAITLDGNHELREQIYKIKITFRPG